ncbi:MAG: hypothetical protein HY822_13655 [Acidobacteria bacterium]|nr:hypothetical protein [Acidobacteriota bacterium]
MNRIFLTTLLAVGLAGGAAQAQTINQRRANQQKRIAEGARSGELTNKEIARLEAEEARLTKMLREDKKDGAGLSARERAKIQKQLDKISRDITKQKHDLQKKAK